jgi:hypothetical protein
MNFLKEQGDLWKSTDKLSGFLSTVNGFGALFYVGGHGHK